MDYTVDYTVENYRKYNGEQWMILQNGENIIIAKKSAILRLTKDDYALLIKKKIISHNISDVDVIFVKKGK